jgi:hypothetical protein
LGLTMPAKGCSSSSSNVFETTCSPAVKTNLPRLYASIFATTPAATVRPPSRTAKRRPSFSTVG